MYRANDPSNYKLDPEDIPDSKDEHRSSYNEIEDESLMSRISKRQFKVNTSPFKFQKHLSRTENLGGPQYSEELGLESQIQKSFFFQKDTMITAKCTVQKPFLVEENEGQENLFSVEKRGKYKLGQKGNKSNQNLQNPSLSPQLQRFRSHQEDFDQNYEKKNLETEESNQSFDGKGDNEHAKWY